MLVVMVVFFPTGDPWSTESSAECLFPPTSILPPGPDAEFTFTLKLPSDCHSSTRPNDKAGKFLVIITSALAVLPYAALRLGDVY